MMEAHENFAQEGQTEVTCTSKIKSSEASGTIIIRHYRLTYIDQACIVEISDRDEHSKEQMSDISLVILIVYYIALLKSN